MLFVSAGFLFAFMPIFLLAFMGVPNRAKRAVVLIGSIVFYILAHLYNPFAILVLWVTVLFHYFAGMLLHRRRDRFLLALFILVDLIALLSLRLLCNQTTEHYYYLFPTGASFYLLMGISYLIEHYRNPSLRAEDLSQTALYLTFFPIMLAGPLIRFGDFCEYSKQFTFRMDRFARGARFFTIGLVKVMVAAVLVEAYDNILQYSNMQVNLGIGFLSLVMMYLIVFFAFSGYSDMGVGLCTMMGLPVRRDYQNPLLATSPMTYLQRFFISFYDFWQDYVSVPLSGLFGGFARLRRCVDLILYMLALTLWFRTDLAAPLIVLPLLCAVLLEELTPLGTFLKRRCGKPFGWLLTMTVTVLYWTMQKLGSYGKLTEYLHNLSEVSGSYQSLYTYATSIGSDFIIVAAIALVILLPLSQTRDTLMPAVPAKLRIVKDVVITLILMVMLMLCIVYFIPQFPQYAVNPYTYFVI